MSVHWGFGLTLLAFCLHGIPAMAADSNKTPISELSPPTWVVGAYAKKATNQTGLLVKPQNVKFEKIDLNGDGHTDWIVYSTIYCGSTGCDADAYAFINGSYCYVGWTRYGDAPGALRNKYTNLKCQSEDIQLEDPL